MNDALDKLRAAMRAATPEPDSTARARHLRLAQENFARAQETGRRLRPDRESHPTTGRLASGVTWMFHTLTGRGALVASTALVATAVIFLVPQTQLPLSPQGPLVISQNQTREAGPATVSGRTETLLPMGDRKDTDASMTDELGDYRDATAAAPVTGQATATENEAMAKTAPTADPVATLDRTATLATPQPSAGSPRRLKVENEVMQPPEASSEAFANAEQNPLKVVAEEPVSTFSIDVDTASYSVVRSSLSNGFLPPREAVRVEEMVNYFPYDYPVPEAGGAPFRPTVTVMQTPWNPDTELVHIAFQGEMPAIADRPPLNLVFLIDTSGSMQDADKLPLLKQSFRLMIGQLRPQDRVAIVTYAGSAGEVLEPTPASDKRKIIAALDNLAAGGSTAGQAGLQQAYQVAEDMAADGRVGRVILATDGDFNVGLSDPDALKDFIAGKRDSGTFLSVLGFGRGNLDDATMQALAQNGNGQAAYIDTLGEAQKVLVDQLTGELFPIAKDVKIQVEFNPAIIAEYRLIGYETRALKREDFNNDRVDAGEIGAGHSVTALYEVTPVGSPALRNDPLRYQPEAIRTGDLPGELGFLRLRYKQPDAGRSDLIEVPILPATGNAGTEARFAAAIAGFGQLLTGGDYLGDWGWDDAIALASANRGADAFGYRAEAVTLMRLAESLSN